MPFPAQRESIELNCLACAASYKDTGSEIVWRQLQIAPAAAGAHRPSGTIEAKIRRVCLTHNQQK